MLKRLVNLPFKVLGRAARAVQARDEAARAAEHGSAADAAAVGAPMANVPEVEVPEDFDPGAYSVDPRRLVARYAAGDPVEFVDVSPTRPRRTLPGALHVPVDTLGIDLAELPPAGQPIVIVATDRADAERATRFLRWRGIDDAVTPTGGLAAWEAAGGPVGAPEA
jgi:rhodanese-related sulfurtransferase